MIIYMYIPIVLCITPLPSFFPTVSPSYSHHFLIFLFTVFDFLTSIFPQSFHHFPTIFPSFSHHFPSMKGHFAVTPASPGLSAVARRSSGRVPMTPSDWGTPAPGAPPVPPRLGARAAGGWVG